MSLTGKLEGINAVDIEWTEWDCRGCSLAHGIFLPTSTFCMEGVVDGSFENESSDISFKKSLVNLTLKRATTFFRLGSPPRRGGGDGVNNRLVRLRFGRVVGPEVIICSWLLLSLLLLTILAVVEVGIDRIEVSTSWMNSDFSSDGSCK